jgi:hypothetical protein
MSNSPPTATAAVKKCRYRGTRVDSERFMFQPLEFAKYLPAHAVGVWLRVRFVLNRKPTAAIKTKLASSTHRPDPAWRCVRADT